MENQVPNDSRRTEPALQQLSESGCQTRLWGLARSRRVLLPTWRGCLVLAIGATLILFWVVRDLHAFLAVSDPVSNGILVVEGWTPDYGMELVRDKFKQDHHEKIYVTGGPIEYGMHLSAYQSYAQLGAATLIKLGLDSNVVQAVPAPFVKQDRTYYAALTL